MTWLVRDNRDLLKAIDPSANCSDGRLVHELDPTSFVDCTSATVPSSGETTKCSSTSTPSSARPSTVTTLTWLANTNTTRQETVNTQSTATTWTSRRPAATSNQTMPIEVATWFLFALVVLTAVTVVYQNRMLAQNVVALKSREIP